MSDRYSRYNEDDSRDSRSGRSGRSSRSRQSGQPSRSRRSSRSDRSGNSRRDVASRYSRASDYSRERYGSASRESDRSGMRYSTSRSSRGARSDTASRYSRSAAGSASQYSRNDEHYSTKAKRRMGRGKKIVVGVICALLVVLVGGGAAIALYINDINNRIGDGLSESDRLTVEDTLKADSSFNEPFYMMLVGSDERTGDASMGARSDTNIVARIDIPNATVTLVSIPRDTLIDLDGYGVTKFNTTYGVNGLTGVITEASDLLDVEISHYAVVNFDQLVQLVDAIGGVDVVVPERIDDPDAGNIVIEAGEQHLNGEAALVFARSRAYLDGDFTRTSNQRLLIEAIINKVLTLGPVDLLGAISAAADCVTTDLDVAQLGSLAYMMQSSEKPLTMYSCMVPSTIDNNAMTADGIVSAVRTDQEGLAAIMEVVEAGGDPSTVQTVGATGSVLDDNDSNDGPEAGEVYDPSNEFGSY